MNTIVIENRTNLSSLDCTSMILEILEEQHDTNQFFKLRKVDRNSKKYIVLISPGKNRDKYTISYYSK